MSCDYMVAKSESEGTRWPAKGALSTQNEAGSSADADPSPTSKVKRESPDIVSNINNDIASAKTAKTAKTAQNEGVTEDSEMGNPVQADTSCFHRCHQRWACRICGKTSWSPAHLRVHMRVHTGERPACCHACGKQFRTDGNLARHLLTHTGERPFACEYCSKRGKKQAFSSSERELIETLVGERPIIEDKRTNSKNIELKKRAWEDLTVIFNAQPYVSQRTCVQLKRCWENIKTLRKKELSQEPGYTRGTSGGTHAGSTSTSSDIDMDTIYPIINLSVPNVDSNTIEISDDLNDTECSVELTSNAIKIDKVILDEHSSTKKRKCVEGTDVTEKNSEVLNEDNIIEDEAFQNSNPVPKRLINKDIFKTPDDKKYHSEVDARIQQCSINMQQDQALHELRMQRENILIEREKNTLEYEKEIQQLQLEKIRLEIEILRKTLN